MKRKLKDLTDKQVIQTTLENDLAFRTLLDKEGFKLVDGQSYIYKYPPTYDCYNINNGTYQSKEHYLEKGYEILQASDFLKPSKSEILEQHEARLNELEAKVKAFESDRPQPTEPEIKVGVFGAFADDWEDFKNGDWAFGCLIEIRNKMFCRNANGEFWKHFRPLENPFK